MYRIATVITFLFVVAGCALGGDTVFRAQGSLAGRNADSPKCALHLRLREDGKSVDHRNIADQFNAEFVIPAGVKSYFFSAECPDGPRYQSKEFELGGRTTLGSSLQLGELSPTN